MLKRSQSDIYIFKLNFIIIFQGLKFLKQWRGAMVIFLTDSMTNSTD